MNNPIFWLRVLDIIRTKYPEAIIAGGCVRDYMMNVSAKDIDVFISPMTVSPNFELETGLIMQEVPADRNQEYLGRSWVEYVTDYKFEGMPIQLISFRRGQYDEAIPFGEAVVNSFDMGITQAWFDGEIRETFASQHDRTNGRVTVLKEDSPERLLKRFEAFNNKVGGSFRLFKDGQEYVPVPELF